MSLQSGRLKRAHPFATQQPSKGFDEESVWTAATLDLWASHFGETLKAQ